MGLKYRYQTYQIGAHRIRLRTLRDLDQYVDTGGLTEAAGISREAFPLFGVVWASAEVLANLLVRRDLSDKRVLEVGCGMALVSHTLNAMAVDVTAMDIHPIAGQLLADNTTLNRGRPIPFSCASWGAPDLAPGEYNLIVASDVLYEPKHVRTLPAFIDRHLATAGEVIIVDPDRGQSDGFLAEMQERGFECRTSTPDFIDHLNVRYDGAIHELTRK